MSKFFAAPRRAFAACAVAVSALSPFAARADERPLPVARTTIYPGDHISEAMLEEKFVPLAPGAESHMVLSTDGLLGKVARRTLLPGQPIPTIAVDNPRVVMTGAQVRIVFSEGGMQIIAYGVAQQHGAIGEIIRVRNLESGIFVSGRVQADGSILVGEG